MIDSGPPSSGALPGPPTSPPTSPGEAPGPRERAFLGWDRPALLLAAAWLAERAEGEAAGPDALDLRGYRVVLPGGRARRRLLELLVDEAEARGLPLLPPDLVTVGALPERLHQPELPAPPPEVAEAAWRKALKETEPERLAPLLPEPPGPGEGDRAASDVQWDALAATVAGLHAQVGAEGHDFRSVARHAARGLLFNDEERWQVLAGVQLRYRELLVASGFRDREEARLRALARGLRLPSVPSGALESPAHLVLVGLVDLPGVARRFVEGWPGPVTALIHAPAGLGDGFDPLGVVDPAGWEGRTLHIPDGNLQVVTRPDEQAHALLGHLVGLDGTRGAEEISVGVPDPELVPFLSGALHEAGIPARYAGGRPLHRTPTWRLLEAVADLLDGWSYDAFANLLRHPAWPGGGDPLPAVADHYQALHLPALARGYLPSGRRSGEWREPVPEAPFHPRAPGGALLRVRDAACELLHEAGMAGPHGADASARPLSTWAGPIRALIAALHPGWEVDRNHPADRELVAFLAAAAPVLEGFEALSPALDPEPVPAWRALRTFLARLRDVAVPPPADEGAVELLGWLELHLDDAPVLVVTGVNEPFLPESVTADPFLPHALRARLGLADNRRRRARDHYLLEAILHSRPGTLLLAGRRDASGNPLRLSRLLLADRGEAVARRVLRLLGDGAGDGAGDGERVPVSSVKAPGAAPPSGGEASGQPDDASETRSDTSGSHPGAPASHADTPASRGDPSASLPFTLPPEPLISAPGGPPDRIAVTAFRALLRDPYLYALERIRGIERVTDEGRELDPMGFGTLAHAVVEGWAREPGADTQDEATLRGRLDHHLDRVFRDRHGDRPLPALRLQREQLRSRLHALARVQAERNAAGWKIVAVEGAPAGEGVPFEVDGVSILLRGRIDRVDHHPGEGRWQLLDLKTSERATPPDKAHRTGRGVWTDLQLPLYRHLARGLPSPRIEAGEPASDAPPHPPGERPESAPEEAPTHAPFRPLLPGDAALETGYIQLPGDPQGVAFELSTWDAKVLATADDEARRLVRLLRENRFAWDPRTSTLRAGDPLAAVVGRGVMQDDDEADGESDGDASHG